MNGNFSNVSSATELQKAGISIILPLINEYSMYNTNYQPYNVPLKEK